MAKRKPEATREITRKETVRRRKDAERNRRIIFSLVGVGVVLLALIGWGIIQVTVIEPNQAVARVNDTAISLRDFQKEVRFNWWYQQAMGQEISDPQASSLEVLDYMEEMILLREQAQQRGISVTADEVDRSIEEQFGYLRETPTPLPTATPDPNVAASGEPTATPNPTPTPVTLESYQQSYQSFLDRLSAGAGLSRADYRRTVEGNLLYNKLYEAITSEAAKTDEHVRVSHILAVIRTPEPTPTPDPAATPAPTADPAATPTSVPTPAPEPRDAAQALALITELRQRALGGEDFAALAQEFSDDTGSAAQGGELPWFSRYSSFIQEFKDAAFALANPGDLSEPVESVYGYHLIKLLERDPARELSDQDYLTKQQEAFDKWLSDLKSAAKIESFWTTESVPPTPVNVAGG